MADLNFILERIRSGAKVRLTYDYYGREGVEVSRGFLLGKTHVTLDPEAMQRVKMALMARRQARTS
jgi:hypothetical protein